MLMNILLVSCGGFIGSIARFWISNEWNKHVIGTWIANLTGSLLLAIIVRLYTNDLIGESLWLFFGIGYCGAYTTFSTFGKETLEFIFLKQYTYAFLYVCSSFLLAILAVGMTLIWS